MSVLLGVGHLSLQTAPHIFAQDIVFNAEGDGGAAGEPAQLEVGAACGLGEHGEMGHLHQPRYMHKVLYHILWPNFDVARGVWLHNLTKIT